MATAGTEVTVGEIPDDDLNESWRNRFDRLPLSGKYLRCPDHIEPQAACDLFLNDPCLPGILTIDCEQ